MPEFNYELYQLVGDIFFCCRGWLKSSDKIVATIKDYPQISAREITELLGLGSRAVEKQSTHRRDWF